MTTFRDVQQLDGTRRDLFVPALEGGGAPERTIDARHCTLLPALIDPHVHFRTPGLEHKENWKSGARAALRGGVTTVFDMPNTVPPSLSVDSLKAKKALVDEQLRSCAIPLRYGLFLGADQRHLHEIAKAIGHAIGLKIFMGVSTGGLLLEEDAALEEAFRLGAAHDLVVAVHAEEEAILRREKARFPGPQHPHVHSIIRSREAAYLATGKAIELAKRYGTRLYLLHIGTKEEVALIRQAKAEGARIYAETTPHHLFLHTGAYETLGTLAQMNPPLREPADLEALWEGIADRTIDTVGSDHAPHTREEKARPYGEAPSGVPGVETMLPLMLDAHAKGRIGLPRLIELMRTRIEEIFRLPSHDDYVLVDLERTREVRATELATRCGWSPYEGWKLQGVPLYTICQGRVYEV